MIRLRWVLIVVGLIFGSACDFTGSVTYTTAEITNVRVAKDKEGTTETSSFAPTETIYLLATVSNVPKAGITLRFRVFAEDVQGVPPGGSPVFEKYLEVPSDNEAWFNLTPPSNGWPPGKYRIELSRLSTVDEKTDRAFTVP